ncbi:junB proto-oncogene, AP-1 transcription factor subunit b [Gouania willdenowi]|uniref:Transcription factor JunB n=1 Tax=Gouania willdenowi TaxID=441366 RepID=A0A8C5E5L9_GOUWI|nr:transcription factor jun-B-like [Gouania willdenowi]
MSTKMEQPFYHDDSFLAYGHSDAAMHDYKVLKHGMNLNLTEPYQQGPPPDVNSLKLASPELERLIIQNSTGVITTPTPGQYFYNRGITDEQEGFAEGFVKALDELHKMNHIPPNVSIGAGGATGTGGFQPEPPIYTTLNAYCPNPSLSSASSFPTATISYLPHQHTSTHAQFPHAQRLVTLKEEPQTVPDLLGSDGSSPPMSPIDLESQERIKAERKRLRNRLAATKCRRRKLERIARLEEKVKGLKSDNAGLSSTASVLRDQVAQLKQKVLTHVSSGCQLMLTSKMEAF